MLQMTSPIVNVVVTG